MVLGCPCPLPQAMSWEKRTPSRAAKKKMFDDVTMSVALVGSWDFEVRLSWNSMSIRFCYCHRLASSLMKLSRINMINQGYYTRTTSCSAYFQGAHMRCPALVGNPFYMDHPKSWTSRYLWHNSSHGMEKRTHLRNDLLSRHVPSLKLTASLPLKIGRMGPKKKSSSYKHQFSGATVDGRNPAPPGISLKHL